MLVCGENHFDRCFYGTDGLIVRASLDEDGDGLLRLEPHAVCAAAAGELSDSCVLCRVDKEPEGYRLPDTDGGAVRNWFLAENSYRKEGFFSLEDTANDLLDNPRTREIIQRWVPQLYKVMTEKNVIPLGLTMKNILSRDADGLDLKALNAELNEVPNED